MNKKGFTLVELLAVVVILALLALLTSTAVTKLVKDAKDDLSDTQMQLIKSAADTWVADNLNSLPSSGSCSYLTLEDLKNYGLLDNTILDPKNSEEISNDLKIKITTTTSAYGNPVTTAEVNPESIEGCSQIYFPICTIAADSTVQGLNAGAKYNCKVDPNKGEYTFYVLNSPASGVASVNLIMDSNIRRDGTPVKDTTDIGLVEWIDNADFLEMGGNKDDWYNLENTTMYGPITAMDYLQIATSTWTNTNLQTISTFTDDAGEAHNMAKTYTTYARLPYYSEVLTTGCVLYEGGTCPNWMLDYLHASEDYYPNRTALSRVYGYWTLSSSASYSNYARIVNYDGSANSLGVDGVASSGVRPVINVPVNGIIQTNQ